MKCIYEKKIYHTVNKSIDYYKKLAILVFIDVLHFSGS